MANEIQIPHHDLGEIYRGDSWQLPTFVFPESVDLTGLVAKVDFRRRPSRDSDLGDTVSSAGNEAVLTLDPITREVTCVPFVPALEKGRWYADLQLVDPATLDPRGKPLTRTYATFVVLVQDDRTV